MTISIGMADVDSIGSPAWSKIHETGKESTPHLVEFQELIKPCDTLEDRCKVMASILEILGDELTRYMGSLLARLPNPNKSYHQSDLESDIYSSLYSQRVQLRGNWGNVKLQCSHTIKDWWQGYLRERQISENQAIQLQRKDFSEAEEAGELEIPDTLDCIGEIEGTLQVQELLESLPPGIASIIAKKLTDTPTLSSERVRLCRFLSGGHNTQHVLGVLTGNWEGPSTWDKPKNGKAKVETKS